MPVLEVTSDMHHADALLERATSFAHQGELAKAETSFRRALALAPNHAGVLERFARFLAATDALAESIDYFNRALACAPENAEVWFAFAAVQESVGRFDQAAAAYRRGLSLKPSFSSGWTRLGDLLRRMNRREEALTAHRRAIEITPGDAEAHQNLGMLLVDLGRLDDAVSVFEIALEQQPGFSVASSNLLFSMGFALHWSPEVMRAHAVQWECAALTETERQAARGRRFIRRPLRQRPMRLGVLSSELGQHAVGFFLWPWLQALDPARCELFLYPTRLRPESEVESFKSLEGAWTPLVGLTDHRAAERIRADGIDVLIETSGHTKHNRLGIVAQRCAPVQCHYIGYFATTGLTEMDYFIGDSVFTPPAQDVGFTEQVWRLPRSRYAFQPLAQAPEPTWRPDPKGRLWLGSFSQLNKVREQSLAVWSRILRAQPNAHLLLKDSSADDRLVRERVLSTLMREGIEPERVMFVGHTPLWSEHMALYNHVDLALDPVPFTSATTGFEALWMGTPLVTLIGEQPAERQAASMLRGFGRTEWITQNGDDYVRRALELIRDVEGRRQIRLTQRDAMRISELCDGAGLASVLMDAFELMFARWFSAG